MNKVEKMLLEEMKEDIFHKTVTDNFGFVDSLIDQNDLDKLSDKEDNE